jgi:hypothetical protein
MTPSDAALAEIARAATPGPWTPDESGRIVNAGQNALAMVNLALPMNVARSNAAHIAAWHPARALVALAVTDNLRQILSRSMSDPMRGRPQEGERLTINARTEDVTSARDALAAWDTIGADEKGRG